MPEDLAQVPPRPRQGAPARLLAALSDFCFRAPLLVTLLGLGLFLASVAWCATGHLRLDLDRNLLLNSDDPVLSSLHSYAREFPEPEDMVVVVEGGTPLDRQDAVRDLAARLDAERDQFQNIFWGVEMPRLRQGALFYLPTEALHGLVRELEAIVPCLQVLSQARTFPELLEGCRTRLLLEEAPRNPASLDLLNSLLEELHKSLKTRGNFEYRSPWNHSMTPPGPPGGSSSGSLQTDDAGTTFYNTLDGGQKYLLMVQPARRDPISSSRSVERLRQLMAEVERTRGVLRLRVTGDPVLMADELRTSQGDSTRSGVVALVLVGLLFILAFGELHRPLLAMTVLVVGVGWSLGFAALAVGHLNLVTVSVATMLVGLGVDFGIHLIYRYEEERCQGLGPQEAMRVGMATAGLENLAGCLTTAATFYSMALTGFRGLAELGLLAGTGVILCFAAMTTVLPALLFLHERYGRPSRIRHHEAPDLIRMERWYLKRPAVVAGVFLAASLAFLPSAWNVQFEYNFLNLQNPNLQSLRLAQELLRPNGETFLYGVSLARNLDEVERLERRYSQLPTVHHVESVAPLIPREIEAKRDLVRRVQDLVGTLQQPVLPEVQGRGDLEEIAAEFALMAQALDAIEPELLASPDPRVREEVRETRALFTRMEQTLRLLGPGPIEDSLNAFREKLLRDVNSSLSLLQAQRQVGSITLQDVPEPLRVRTVGRSGAIQVRVYPKEGLYDRESMDAFVTELRTVDPNVTGSPVLLYHFTHKIMEAYRLASVYGLVTIGLLVLVHYRTIKRALLALLPMSVGILWMLGTMGYLGQPINLVNFISLPLMLGIGSVFGLHVVDRYEEHDGEGVFNTSTGPAVGMSAMTTLLGFVTLVTAGHRGIASLGLSMSVGLGASMLAALIMLPAVIKLLRRWRVDV